MVMSEDVAAAAGLPPGPLPGLQPQERISDREKELAGDAGTAYNAADYTNCLAALEKLEILRPTDVVLAHNKIVVQCRAGQVGEGGTAVSLSEVVQQLEGLAATQGLELTGAGAGEAGEEGEGAVLLFNLAVARFQQRRWLQASQLADRLLPLSPNLSPSLARKILFLQCELSLALHQPEQALQHAASLERLAGEPAGDFDAADSEQMLEARVLVVRARCNVMARMTKSLKKELKSVSLPGTLGHTTEFLRSHIEALHGNHRKSIKMLNSVVQAAGNRVFPHYYNNLGCLHHMMKKPNLAIYYFKNALDRLEAGESGSGQGGTAGWVTQSQVLYNIGLSLLHARRPAVAFDILLEVVGAHYLDPHVWFHLAECCVVAHQPDTEPGARQVSQGGAGAGLSYKLVASNPDQPVVQQNQVGGATPSLSLQFGALCLQNAESLLPAGEGGPGVFCCGVGYIGNPVTWPEVEALRGAVRACQAYTSLALQDYMTALQQAELLLATPGLPPHLARLAHLYAAESLVLQDRVGEAVAHLEPGLEGGEEAGSQTVICFTIMNSVYCMFALAVSN